MKTNVDLFPEAAGVSALAAVTGLSSRRLRQITAEAGIAPVARGLWPVAPTIMAVIAAAGRQRENDAERDARAALMRARAREIEVRTAQREGELVPIAEATAFVTRIVGKMVSLLAALPARATRDVALRRRIEALIDAARLELDKEFEAAAEQYRRGPPAGPEATS